MQCDKKKCAPASTLFPTIAHIYMLPSRYRHEVRCNTHIHIHINMTMFSTHVHVTFKVPRRCFLIPSQMGYQNERKNEQNMVQTHYHSGGGVALTNPASNMFLILACGPVYFVAHVNVFYQKGFCQVVLQPATQSLNRHSVLA